MSTNAFGIGRVDADATIDWINSEGGQDHSRIRPLPVGWMHEESRISRGIPRKVDAVAFLPDDRSVLLFGRNQEGKLPTWRFVRIRSADGAPLSVSFCVRVETPRGFHDRAFRLDADSSQPFGFRVTRLRERETPLRTGGRSLISQIFGAT